MCTNYICKFAQIARCNIACNSVVYKFEDMAGWSFITYYCVVTMLLIAYVLGSIPSAVWIGKKYYGIDIREHGSKNAGTTNMLRVLGKRAALPVFAVDFIKGFVAVAIMSILKYDDAISPIWLINLKIIAVFVAVAGHVFPIFAHFKGGKGVATLIGAVFTYLLRKKTRWLAPLPPIAANTIIVPLVLSYAYGVPDGLLYLALTVGIGEVISCGVLGMLLLKCLEKHRNHIFGS